MRLGLGLGPTAQLKPGTGGGGGNPELIVDGAMNGTTNWNVPAGWAISGGVATATGTSSSLLQNGALGGFTPVAGTSYTVSFDWTHSGGTLYVYIGAGDAQTFEVSGHQSFTMVAGPDPTSGIQFFGGAVSGVLDNVSVKAQ